MAGTCLYFVCGSCRSPSCILGYKRGPECKKNGAITFDPLEPKEGFLAYKPEILSTEAKARDQEKNRRKRRNHEQS